MTQQSIKITEHLSVQIAFGNIYTFVDNKQIIICRHALITAPVNADIECVDDMLRDYKAPEEYSLELQDELFVHASNIQTWVEHDYNPNLIDSRIGRAILQELSKVDKKAFHAFLRELENLWKAGNLNSRKSLYMRYTEYIFILCILQIIPVREVRFFNEYIDCAFQHNKNIDPTNLTTEVALEIIHNTRTRYFKDFIKQEALMYPDPSIRYWTNLARRGDKRAIISDPTDYPAYVFATKKWIKIKDTRTLIYKSTRYMNPRPEYAYIIERDRTTELRIYRTILRFKDGTYKEAWVRA